MTIEILGEAEEDPIGGYQFYEQIRYSRLLLHHFHVGSVI